MGPYWQHVAEVELELLEVLLNVDSLDALKGSDVPNFDEPVGV